ncbi:hypothetical protein D0Z07_4360 [Hyphodiscus hymeniophilus]|uniref:PH domain-containing protein n=1 Tax=Hyphodiscus hymeniophilus TaxID=353542 RepID=A0A9P6VKM0_9HELO|nr:hypothetical protein D0Z07_4360 [Hyphodiscus hymeniophilus]
MNERRKATTSTDDRDGSGEGNRTDTFQNLQTAFASAQRARPPVMEFPGEIEESRVPLKAGKIQRRESKGRLRGMFTRTKVDKNVVPVLEELSNPANSDKPKAVIERSLSRSHAVKIVNTLPAPTPPIPSTPKATSKPLRMNLRSKSVKYTKPAPKPSPKSSTKSSPKPPTRTSAAWDPPPLFQAYPQAIKHATLSASTLSADSILRISNDKRTNSVRNDFAQSHPDAAGPPHTPAAKKAEKAKSKHRRQISGSISKADWTQKIFVLVTSGYLLQYAGEGSFDRLPEKMMQLGKESVAFASDVIPGKHWVLQISQSMNADGTPTADSRSLLSRLAFRGADYRRTATSLLLVLNSAEDMDSWIAVVRREIEELGGKKHVSETGKSKSDGKVMQLEAQPSHRYLIQRGPDQLSNPASPSSPSFAPPWAKDEQIQGILEDAASALNRPLSTLRPSTGHQSISNSVISHDGRHLDSLRDSTNRFSLMSSGQRTLVTSQISSTASSPVRDSYPSIEEFPTQISNEDEDARPRPNAAAINERRRSMQTMQIPVLDDPQPKIHRHSTLVVPIRPSSSQSTKLNFSTPKRLTRVLVPQTPPVPTIVTTTATPGRARDSILKGSKTGPPVALNVVRSLPLVDDLPSPGVYASPVFTPADSSLNMVQQVKASVVSIPPRSPSASNTISPVDLPHRLSSLMPLSSGETARLDFQFPKRFSSMQNLLDAVDPSSQAPLRLAPLPPAALTTPLPRSPYFHGDESEAPNDCDHEIKLEEESPEPLPILANSKQKLRRPASMQIRPPSSTSPIGTTRSPRRPLISTNKRSSIARSPGSSLTGGTSPASVAVVSPSLQRLRVQAPPKAVANRKTMRALVDGPPPAPPPDYALPPLPPGSAGLRSPTRVRGSVRV